ILASLVPVDCGHGHLKTVIAVGLGPLLAGALDDRFLGHFVRPRIPYRFGLGSRADLVDFLGVNDINQNIAVIGLGNAVGTDGRSSLSKRIHMMLWHCAWAFVDELVIFLDHLGLRPLD